MINQHFDLHNANELDRQLLCIENLRWLPWIGEKYLALPTGQRVLLIGESHYYEDKEPGSFEKHQMNGYTRFAIQKTAVEREYRTYKNGAAKIFPNFHRTIFRNDNFESKLLWENVCYYNFIQEPMNTKKGRPQKNHFEHGWKTFAEVVTILQPTYCIFLGNSAANYFPDAFPNDTTILQKVTHDGWVNNSTSRKALLKLTNGNETKVKFIKHPSKFYSWPKWNEHLQLRYPDLMNWFTSLPKISSS